VNVRTHQYQRIITDQLPLLAEEFQPDKHQREQLDDYVNRLQQWIAGDLAWHLGDPPRYSGTRRYDVPEALDPAALLFAAIGPTGLGTSAARPTLTKEYRRS